MAGQTFAVGSHVESVPTRAVIGRREVGVGAAGGAPVVRGAGETAGWTVSADTVAEHGVAE